MGWIVPCSVPRTTNVAEDSVGVDQSVDDHERAARRQGPAGTLPTRHVMDVERPLAGPESSRGGVEPAAAGADRPCEVARQRGRVPGRGGGQVGSEGVGDTVLALRNDRTVGILNGDDGCVIGIDRDRSAIIDLDLGFDMLGVDGRAGRGLTGTMRA